MSFVSRDFGEAHRVVCIEERPNLETCETRKLAKLAKLAKLENSKTRKLAKLEKRSVNLQTCRLVNLNIEDAHNGKKNTKKHMSAITAQR